MSRSPYSRRDFLRGSCGLLACGGLSAMLPQMQLIPSAVAGVASGYKALVCVFLNGGNDSWNLLMPGGGTAHSLYVTARNGLYDSGSNAAGLALRPAAVPAQAATATMPPSAIGISGTQYGVNPFAPELATLYGEGNLAFLANVGAVVHPLTRAGYNSRPRPPQLYSHNDQTNLWHIGSGSNTQVTQGWGGRVAGLTSKLSSAMAGLPPTITLSGQSRFLVGEALNGTPLFPFTLSNSSTSPAATLIEYGVSGQNAREMQTVRNQYLQEMLDLANPQAFTEEYRAIVTRSRELALDVINPAFATVNADSHPVNAPFAQLTGNGGNNNESITNTGFFQQLRQIARMIRVSTDPNLPNPINANRQVFFVSIGGFDTHDGQITGVGASGHHRLLQRVSRGVNAFFRAMQGIGLENDVTLLTTSEFARTINSNGNGSDHAWGGVQFVVGGAVNGGQVYGRYPSIALNNSLTTPIAGSDPSQGECFSRGQFLPTLAVDQVSATLARWMGVENAELPGLFPNIDNFVPGAQFLQGAGSNSTPTWAYGSRIVPGLMDGVA